jgi:hypothetical protein
MSDIGDILNLLPISLSEYDIVGLHMSESWRYLKYEAFGLSRWHQ